VTLAPGAHVTSGDGIRRSLLLGSVLLLIGLLLRLGHAELVKPLVGSSLAQRLVGRELGLVLGNFARSLRRFHLNHRNDGLRGDLGGDVHFLLGSVALVRLAQLLGEEDEFGSVFLEALDVLLQRLDALVATTVIDGDADRPGKVLVETSGFDLFESEASSETLLLVVFDGGTSDDRPKRGGGPRGDASGLRSPRLGASDLPSRLIEPRLDAILPILLEMSVLNHVVMLGSHFYPF